MKTTTVLLITSVTMIVLGCNPGGPAEDQNSLKSPEELRMELKLQEQSSPDLYITATATLNPDSVLVREAGLFREAEYDIDGYNLEGEIKNAATLARFKDVVLTVMFMSQTETIIEQSDYTLYEFYEPNSTSPFSIHVYPPEATDKFVLLVKGATAVE
jgi:hypothetical protein